MSAKCSHCGSACRAGYVTCEFCRQPYSAELARSAIPCPQCATLSTPDQSKCVACGAWIVVQCVFCSALSPHTAVACGSCREVFAGAPQRKAQRDAAAAAAARDAAAGAGDDEDDEYYEDGWESDWAWCQKCQAIVWDADPAGTCSRGGRHDTSDSESYWLCLDDEDYDGQGNFRWCSACQCLYRGGAHAGVCAATKGTHTGDATYEYLVAKDGDYDEDYGGWAVCKRCAVVFWGEDAGACAAGGGHDGRGSPNYEIWHEDE